MAKASRKNRRATARKKAREQRAMERGGKVSAPKARNAVVLGMILRGAKGGNHGDARKEAARKACRGKWSE